MNEYRMQQSTSLEEPAAFKPESYIGIDARPTSILLAHTFNGIILETLEARPNQLERVINFVARTKQNSDRVILVGARTDRWPPGLHPALVERYGPITWVPPLLIAQTAGGFRKSTRIFRFLRASYLAACIREQPHKDVVLSQWRRDALTEITYALDLGPPPDIPF